MEHLIVIQQGGEVIGHTQDISDNFWTFWILFLHYFLNARGALFCIIRCIITLLGAPNKFSFLVGVGGLGMLVGPHSTPTPLGKP